MERFATGCVDPEQVAIAQHVEQLPLQGRTIAPEQGLLPLPLAWFTGCNPLPQFSLVVDELSGQVRRKEVHDVAIRVGPGYEEALLDLPKMLSGHGGGQFYLDHLFYVDHLSTNAVKFQDFLVGWGAARHGFLTLSAGLIQAGATEE
jgi:hypothetical protein